MNAVIALAILAWTMFSLVYFADKLDKYYAKKRQEKERLREYAYFSLSTDSIQPIPFGAGTVDEEATTQTSAKGEPGQ